MSADEIIRTWKAEDDTWDTQAPENPAGKQRHYEKEEEYTEDEASTLLSSSLKCLVVSKPGERSGTF
ncbi:hypothetical protein KSF_091510 [Reticulibacter mediterranei]|uniref:Uncharacterized protein n=1 Tax=Reticulibacter mediterranei TaxID=2778369 RepID=A0A8J3IV53_9CHLR|nr:hypothetical protein [Reticulibacter mediterranei]GHO99103.1 hypothetical protein KSF_091510 [Reticulibacter mediterranei]